MSTTGVARSARATPGVLYGMGTIATINSVQRGLGGVQLMLHGETRGTILNVTETNGYLEAVVAEASDQAPIKADDPAFVALYREARERASELGQNSGLPADGAKQA